MREKIDRNSRHYNVPIPASVLPEEFAFRILTARPEGQIRVICIAKDRYAFGRLELVCEVPWAGEVTRRLLAAIQNAKLLSRHGSQSMIFEGLEAALSDDGERLPITAGGS